MMTDMHISHGRVSLVGAGPGHPDLITVRGLALLRTADVVIFDRLVGRLLLDEVAPHAKLIDAGKSPKHHTLTQDEINVLIVAHAQAGSHVLRLKGGDPFIFGRGWEELRACREAGIACEVVPGVSSAIAAPAAAGIPVTVRGIARSFAIVTPQSDSSDEPAPLNYAALSQIDTVSVLMARGVLGEVADGFVRAGRSPQTRVAVVQNGTLSTQRVVLGTLADIAERADANGVAAPAVVVIGAAVGLAEVPATADSGTDAESGRLAGKRIVVTRPDSASPPLIAALRAESAEVIECPLISIEYIAPANAAAICERHAWIVFTSLHGVRGFWRVLLGMGLDARALAGSRVAAVGPKTAAELQAVGIIPDLVPSVHRASALIDEIVGSADGGMRTVLFPCGTLARDELRAGLRRAGLCVNELVVYDTLSVAPTRSVRRNIERGVDAIMLYSPSGVRSAVEAGLNLADTTLACIGPTTADAARGLGLNPAVVPAIHTDAGLVDALATYFARPLPISGAHA